MTMQQMEHALRCDVTETKPGLWTLTGTWARIGANGLLAPARWNQPGWEEVAHWRDGFWIGVERACSSPPHSGAGCSDGLPVLRVPMRE